MKIGIVGSRRVDEQVKIEILRHIPEGTTEIVSGGADGVDTYASELAELLHIPLKVFLPDYEKYGKKAPLMRNLDIIRYADEILAFWDGHSAGTRHVISACLKEEKSVHLIPIKESGRVETGGFDAGKLEKHGVFSVKMPKIIKF